MEYLFWTDHEDVKSFTTDQSKELNIIKDTKLSEKKLVQAKGNYSPK